MVPPRLLGVPPGGEPDEDPHHSARRRCPGLHACGHGVRRRRMRIQRQLPPQRQRERRPHRARRRDRAGWRATATNASPGAAAATTTVDAKAAGEVPAAIKSKGTLTVAAAASYAPNEFFGSDGKTVQGMDADLAKALAGALGLKAKVVNATFVGIIPGLAANKYDLGMSSFTDTKEREKTVDFVTYFSAGTSFYVKAQGGPAITGLDSLCGHKVAAEKGTTQADDAAAQDKKCKAAGKAGVTVSVFPDQNG